MRRVFEHIIEIRASRQQVWDTLVEFEAYGVWNPFMRKVAGAAEVGSRLRIELQPPRGRRIVVTPSVVTADPGRELRWAGHLPLGLFAGEHDYLIEPSQTGVRVTHRGWYRGALVRLLGPMIDNTSIGFERMHAALKRRAEELASPGEIGLEAEPAASHETADAERVTVAAELRDDTLQTLAALRLTLDRLIAAWRRGDAATAEQTGEAALRMADDAVERTRRLAFSIVPPLLAEGGLAGALGSLPGTLGMAERVTVDVSAHRYPVPVELACYRAVEELLRGIREHARARRVSVEVSDLEHAVEIRVIDDGIGLDRTAAAGDPRLLELRSVAHRLRAAGGALMFESSPAGGTRVWFRLPVDG